MFLNYFIKKVNMKKLSIVIAMFFLFGNISFAKEIIRHIHWTQPPYDEIIMQTAKDFMAENPNVKSKFN